MSVLSECPYEVGDKLRFKPTAYFAGASGYGSEIDVEVTGTVERVHERHRWYRVRYATPLGVAYECFKF